MATRDLPLAPYPVLAWGRGEGGRGTPILASPGKDQGPETRGTPISVDGHTGVKT